LDTNYFYDQPGVSPGTLRIAEDATPPSIRLIDYSVDHAVTHELATPEECIPFLDSDSISWIDVQGLGNEAVLQRLGKVFGLHPLLLEDVVNVPQRPKVEQYPDQLLIIARMVLAQESGFTAEQVGLIVGKNYLLTVQEEPNMDCFDRVRKRINSHQPLRKQGADYLACALFDAIIDGFYPVLESYGERLEALEDQVVISPTRQTLQEIHDVRRELLLLRRAIWPQRDALNILIRDGQQESEVRFYLRDVYDHTVEIIDMVETYRELAAGLMDVYLSSVSNRMNEVMKFLTIISTIFIPLTFIVGIYGMNFNVDKSPYNMPELNWYWGYPLVMLLMLGIAGVLILYFWRKGWFRPFS